MVLIPYVIEDTGRGERSMDIYSRLLKDRIIFIGTEINDQVANSIIAQLMFLRAEDPKKDVSIYINSPGGLVSAGLAIYDTIRFLGLDVNTYCIGEADSISALILCSGTKGKRFALPHSRMMIHQPRGGITGSSADIRIQAKEILHARQILATLFSKDTGQSLQKILADFDRDFHMSPKEAVAYGLIDKVIETS